MNYAFNFPNKGVNNYVKLPGKRSLTAFTVCLWMSSTNSQGSLFSYAVSSQANEILISYNTRFQLYINGESRDIYVTANDGVWHQICISWASSSGSWQFYKDGLKVKEGSTFKRGHTISQSGTLVLGQDQDSVGGGFQADDSFQGLLSDVNVWDSVLTGTTINETSRSCVLDEWNEANVYQWSDFLRQGGTKLLKPSSCKPFEFADNSKCDRADWEASLDRAGWSRCPKSNTYLRGLYRNVRVPDDERVGRIEYGRCCPASEPAYANETSYCSNANWVSTLDGNNVWALCPTGFYLNGLRKSDGGDLHNIEEGQCCRPVNQPDNKYYDCYDEDVTMSFDNKGWNQCQREGYFMTGLYKSNCDKIYCIEKLKCCRMKPPGDKSLCESADWQVSLDRSGWSVCPQNNTYLKGLWRHDRKIGDERVGRIEFGRCCTPWERAFANQPSVCTGANWWTTLDGNNVWALCPAGYFLNGLYKTSGEKLYNIEEGQCCRPVNEPGEGYDGCYDEDVTTSFDNRGWSDCQRTGYYMTGIYKSSCEELYCIEKFKCCKMRTTGDKSLCEEADWQASLDRQGWSVCPQNNTYLKGLWRNVRKSGDERVGRIEFGRCCTPWERVFANQPAVCTNANWWSTLDGNNVWALCPDGYFLNGLYKSGGEKLYNIEEGQCCRPVNEPGEGYDGCYDEDVTTEFDNVGWSDCQRTGYYMTGIYKSSCEELYCIEKFKCCKMRTTPSDKSQCDKADWVTSLDRAGWSVCPKRNTYLRGLYRSERASGDDRVGRIENGRCCPASEPAYANQPATCSNAQWWSTLDGNNVWALCPGGYFLNGLRKSDGENLYNIEEGQCCRPQNRPENSYDDCYDEDVTISFDNKGWSECQRAGYYMTGIYKSSCEELYCIEKFKCCLIKSECNQADWVASLDRQGWSVCPKSNTYLKGLYRSDRKSGDERVGRIEYGRCCHASEPAYAKQPATCTNAQWWSTFDGNHVWALCPYGYFLNGLYKSGGEKLYNIEEGQCCRPLNQPEDGYDGCYDEDVTTSFDNRGWSECQRAGYYMTGIYKSSCEELYCIEKFKCCRMKSPPESDTPSGPGNWTYWNGHYYNHLEKSAANSWYSAEGVCREHGDTVHLTSIHSQRENDFIRALSPSQEEQWIGLTDHNVRSNSFKWIDRSPYGNFTNWAVGEPNQFTLDEDCGAMKPDGKWIDVACRKQRLYSDTPFDRRAFTCKTSGNTVTYGTSPSIERQVKEEHDPAVSIVDLSAGGQAIKISFFTGLHYIAPNTKFSSTADKVQKGALLKFGRYVQMTSGQLDLLNPDGDNDYSGVADLDGVGDKIEIPHYSEMSTIGSTSSPGFSIEFWVRPRRLPDDDTTPMALFYKASESSGSINLNLNSDGSLAFSIILNRETKVTCTTDVSDETNKVRALRFQHIAVTGTVGSSLIIKVNGDTACQKTTWNGITVLAASHDGTLVFGESDAHSRTLERFNGQISNIQLFNTQRTKAQIDRSINQPNPTAAGSVGFWSLRQSDEINVVLYVISNSQSVSQLKVLADYDPPLTGLPVEAVVRGQKIYIVRATGGGQVEANKFTLSSDRRTITPLQGNQRIIASSQAKKGCLAATLDSGRNRLVVVECFPEDQSSGAVRFKWHFFEISTQGQLTATTQSGGTGSLLVKDVGSLDTRLSAKIVNNHLLLSAGTTSGASILFLDITLSSNGVPSISVNELAAQPVGPVLVNNGATYYAYLRKDTDASAKPYLRRLRPQSGQPSNSYVIDVRDVNPSSLVATNPISSNMPDNDWFWFLFRITTLNSGVAIQSGERINIQTPDNNPQNEEGWSYVKLSCQTLQANQRAEQLNFWIFKTRSCDPRNSGFSVVSGEIGPNDCILIWPKTEEFEPGNYQAILALPTEREIENAKVRFGSWFGPWRLIITMEPSPVRPIPVSDSSPPNSPRNVYQGNKYSLLHFGEGISLAAPSSRAGVRGGLLQFAKTTVTPAIVSNNGSPSSTKLVFRGNGGSFPLAGLPHDQRARLEVLFSTVYQEGSYAQRRMTSGLFYSIAYTPPSGSSSSGEFKNLTRIGGLESLEYPDPPTSFVWLIPPPFKVAGMSAAISTLFQFNDDTVKNVAPNSLASLTEVIIKAVGPGSFGEGLFKPFVSVHFDVTILNKIGQQIHEAIVRKINEYIPEPPPASPRTRPSLGTPSWQQLGDLEASVALSNTTFWKDKVRIQRIKDKLTRVLQSKWMNDQIVDIREEVAPGFLEEASDRYSAYGGIAVLIATRLRSGAFLEELLTKDKTFIQPILDSHLKVLDFIRPDLGIAVREDIMSALLAKEITAKPWSILESLDIEKQREALSAAISAIYEGPDVAEEVKLTFTEFMKELLNAILYPITSTQLGIFANFLDMRKLDVLAAVDQRALDFKERFLDIFVQGHVDDAVKATNNEPSSMGEKLERIYYNKWVET
ncbi:uncharacterized protein LOC144647504 [Oculina patagonica]